MQLPELIEQLGVRDLGGIEGYFDGFGVTGAIGADIAIAGVSHVAAGVPHNRVDNAGDASKGAFDTPKAASCKSRFFHWTLPTVRFVPRKNVSGVQPSTSHYP